MYNFPMPNDKIGDFTVVASVYYTDEIATVLLLRRNAPFFTVGQVDLETGRLTVGEYHENIVPAVREYEDMGGDY